MGKCASKWLEMHSQRQKFTPPPSVIYPSGSSHAIVRDKNVRSRILRLFEEIFCMYAELFKTMLI